MQITRRTARAAAALAALLLWWKRRSVRRLAPFVRSTWYALASSHLRNMLVFSALATAVTGGSVPQRWRRRVFPLFFAALWSLYYRFAVVEHPTLHIQRTLFNVLITEKARLTKRAFRPTPFAFNAHAQTVICLGLSALEWLWARPPIVHREEVAGFDGNPQPVDWLYQDARRFRSRGDDSPIVLVVHGLGDNIEHPYMKRMHRVAASHGWRLAAHSYWRVDFGESRDLRAVVEHLREQNPRAPIVAIGYSAGGHHLLRYLQTYGRDAHVVAAVSVSGCFDFVQAVRDVEANSNATYSTFLDLQTRVCVRRHLEADRTLDAPCRARLEAVMREERQCLRLYDRFLHTLPSYTHRSQEDQDHEYAFMQQTAEHYRHATAARNMDAVAVTTLVLHSEDDPVVSGAHVDWESFHRNRNIITLRTKRGGHVGWYEGLLPFGDTWSDAVCADFISAVLETHSHTTWLVDVVRRAIDTGKSGADVMRPDVLARICSASDLSALPGH